MNGDFDAELRARVGDAARQWSPAARLRSLEPVTKGSSSLTYAAELDTAGASVTAYVKVAPPGLEPVRNRDVLRQAAVLDVLRRDGSVPVPRVLFQDAGAPPGVPPFFATESVAGACVEPLIDDADLPGAGILTARATDAARTLARLHRVDPAPLAGAERAEHADLGREVARWERIFATVDGGLAVHGGACGERLRATAPTPLAPVIVHGDFRLGNVICGDAHVHAILDWEIWSLTDPRIDVAWFLMTLSAHSLPSAIRTSAPGLLTPEAALEVYEQAAGTSLDDLPWFSALSSFRAAAAMALNIKHNRRRPTPNPRIESYGATLPRFLDVAMALIDTRVRSGRSTS